MGHTGTMTDEHLPHPGRSSPEAGTDPAGHDADSGANERNRRWASTMAGHGGPGITFAHADSHASASGGTGGDEDSAGTGRRWRARPRPGRAGGAGGRSAAPGGARGHRRRAPARWPEDPDRWRTCFERDRDRILHATAFRRLAGKTQVFVFPDDHQRTRLTHALEVAQVATSIARTCRLNVALTEAIALGHDCGHGPGGHASEDALPLPRRRVRPCLVGGGRLAGLAQPVSRDPGRHPQPLVVPTRARDTRRRGGELGRSHRLRVS